MHLCGVLAIAAHDGSTHGDDEAERIRKTWRAELAASDGDRREALKRTCKLSGIKRAKLYRLLAELGEDVDR